MNLKTKILNLAGAIARDNVYMYSAQASFYIIISSIPFIMMLLSLAKFILPVSESDIMIIAAPFLPDVVLPSFENIIHEIFYKVSRSVISLSAISSIWTASRGIQAIERGTRNVYHSPSRSMIIWDILASFLYTAVFIFIMILFLTVFVFGNSIVNFLELKSGVWLWIFSRTAWLKWVFTFILLTAIFSLIYMAFSGKKIHPKNHIHGAIFTTAVWMLFSFTFSFYIENFANYSYIYGSLAAIVLMMLWVYCCMIIFLVGGEINMAVITGRIERRRRRRELLGHNKNKSPKAQDGI
jgi:membrane protein